MGKAPASDSIMAPDKMKSLLSLSKKEPVQAAIGLTGDGEGLILLDKKAKPKKVFSMLKASASKAKLQLNTSSLRFGRAEVDPEYDPGMVRFFVNKEAPGAMRIKLVELVKRIPYQQVEINVDPSLEAEPEEDADSTQSPTVAAAEPPASPPAPLDAAGCRRQLAVLIGRIAAAAGGDAARKAALVALATQGNDSLKANDLAAATGFIARLQGLLDGGGTGAAPGDPPLLPIWIAAKDDADQQLASLYSILKQSGMPVLNEVAEEIEAVLENFRVGLLTALMNHDRAAGLAKDAARAAAMRTVTDYRNRLAADKHVVAADTNPFGVPISLRETLGTALSRLQERLLA